MKPQKPTCAPASKADDVSEEIVFTESYSVFDYSKVKKIDDIPKEVHRQLNNVDRKQKTKYPLKH